MTGDLHINGALTATTKSFVINHPSKPGKKLRYGDVITIPSEELEITIVSPTTNELPLL